MLAISFGRASGAKPFIARTLLPAAAACAISWLLLARTSASQEDPLSWFPLQVGNSWIYQQEWKTGDLQRPEVTRWTTKETITGLLTIPEGLVVLRQVKQQGESRGGYVAERGSSNYLVHGSCVYFLDDSWDNGERNLRSQYRRDLSNGTLAPDLCFPLKNGERWGTKDVPWRVHGTGHSTDSFLPPGHESMFHIATSHFGSGGHMDLWFEKGVGVVAERYIHQGTYEEYTKRLQLFTPVVRKNSVRP